MKYKLGTQRPLDIRDTRERLRPSIVGVLFVLPAILLAAGLLVHLALQLRRGGPGLGLAVAVGLGSLVAVWGLLALLPSASPDAPRK